MRTPEQIAAAQDRLFAAQECRNLMGKMSAYLGENRTGRFVSLWADRDDDSLDMPWGGYDGIEGVRRCWTVDIRDIEDEDSFELLKGFWLFDQISTDYIEVAGDGQTAKGVFTSWKLLTNPTYNELGVYSRNSYYVWCKYAVDFLQEDGVWKFWHLRQYLLFKSIYCAGRITDLPYRGFELRKATCDRPPLPAYAWEPDAIYPVDEPALPEPYESFSSDEQGA